MIVGGLFMPSKSKTEQLNLFSALATRSEPKHGAPSRPSTPCSRCTESYLSDHQVAARFDISKATVWRWHTNNPDFPRRIKLSPGTSRWKLSELVQFEMKMQSMGSFQ
jgi:predicted DNA-binding transcriptional regulator AlpA